MGSEYVFMRLPHPEPALRGVPLNQLTPDLFHKEMSKCPQDETESSLERDRPH